MLRLVNNFDYLINVAAGLVILSIGLVSQGAEQEMKNVGDLNGEQIGSEASWAWLI